MNAMNRPEALWIKFMISRLDFGLFQKDFLRLGDAVGGVQFTFQVVAQLEQLVGVVLGIDKMRRG